jgi:hypothetical protein
MLFKPRIQVGVEIKAVKSQNNLPLNRRGYQRNEFHPALNLDRLKMTYLSIGEVIRKRRRENYCKMCVHKRLKMTYLSIGEVIITLYSSIRENWKIKSQNDLPLNRRGYYLRKVRRFVSKNPLVSQNDLPLNRRGYQYGLTEQ